MLIEIFAILSLGRYFESPSAHSVQGSIHLSFIHRAALRGAVGVQTRGACQLILCTQVVIQILVHTETSSSQLPPFVQANEYPDFYVGGIIHNAPSP